MDIFKKLKGRLNDEKNDEAQVGLWTSDKAGYSDDAPDITRLAIADTTQVEDDQSKDYPLPQGMAATYFSGEFKTTGEEFATGLGNDRDASEKLPSGTFQHFNPLEPLIRTSRLGHTTWKACAVMGSPGKNMMLIAESIASGTPEKDPLIANKETSSQPACNYPALAPNYDNDSSYRYNQQHGGSEHDNSGSDSESSSDSECGADSEESSEEQQSRDEDANDYRRVERDSDSPTGHLADRSGHEYKSDYEESEEGDGFLNNLQEEGREQIVKQIDERLVEGYGELAEELFEGEKAPSLLSGVPWQDARDYSHK